MDFHTTPVDYPGDLPPRDLREATTTLLKDTGFLEQYKERAAAAPKDAQTRRDRISIALRDRGRKIGKAADREQIRRVLDDVLALPEPTTNRHADDRTLRFMQDPVAWEDEIPKAKPVPEVDPTTFLYELLNAPMNVAGYGQSAGSSLTGAAKFWVDETQRHDSLFAAMLCQGQTHTGRTHDKLTPTWTPPHPIHTKKETTMHTTPITVTTKTFTYVNGVDINNFRSAELYDLIAREEDQIRKLEAIENKPLTLQQEIARRRQGIADLVAHLDSQVPADQAAAAA